MFQVLPAGFVPPCLPTFVRIAPEGPKWAYEIKHDGFRFIARRDGDRVRVFSRNAKDWTHKVEALHLLPVTSATIDGEGVVVDDRGVTDFERLRAALAARGRSRRVFLFAFDLIELDGDNLRPHPWEIRRATLTRLLRKGSRGIRLSEHLDGDGETIFRHACALGGRRRRRQAARPGPIVRGAAPIG